MSLGYSETFHRYPQKPAVPGAAHHAAACVSLLPAHERSRRRSSAAIKEAEQKLDVNISTLAALVMEPLMQGAAGMWAQPVGLFAGDQRNLPAAMGFYSLSTKSPRVLAAPGKCLRASTPAMTPDILCLAKGITGGYLPLAATIDHRGNIFAAFLGEYKEYQNFFHGHTYTGNPLGCAVAIANLELFNQESFVEKMQPRIVYLQQTLARRVSAAAPMSATSRQWGYMIGIELAQDKASRKNYPPEKRIGHKVILEARKRSVMIRPLGDVIMLDAAVEHRRRRAGHAARCGS